VIVLKHDIDKLRREMQVHGKQVPFATALALTRTAQAIKVDEEKEVVDVFDRPTPYTRKSFFVIPATKVTLRAEVEIKNDATEAVPPSAFLRPQIFGGNRSLKRFELALRNAGVLPNGYLTVPGSAARLDAFGNMSKGQIVQILSYFKTNGLAGFNFNATDASLKRRSNREAKRVGARGVQYFVGAPGDGKLPLGIWQRFSFSRGTAIKPVLLFIKFATFQKRFDFYYVGELGVEKYFHVEYAKAWEIATRSAR
jgi:hypothetical protein